ncbi:hypothetical protein SASPL_111496 [Salvia splendens]|uniref:Clp R domain-containing protein n=1 Tax=Salvia splendens TaxID=180675 RepID=A0A8X8Y9M2_SALSN|nr:hypothetical protein SASPL_111496 [Salvia splendens]
MRSGGGYSLHHSLTVEATAIVKQAVGLARRRGHAQVSPLHVASAMLASPAGLLKRACLQSHSHPLQCKALELCFNVALNRLPTSSPAPLLGPHSHLPSLSNALVAAFKRAQAHQRRGSIESQQEQQSILALKVEVQQLLISILDDPSVSRVMREAGFSSTQVKSNVGRHKALPPLDLTLHSGMHDEKKQMACCCDCTQSFEKEAELAVTSGSSGAMLLPSWLQQYKDGMKKQLISSNQLNSENLRILTAALEEKVQWQKHIAPDIATAILRCRSRRGRDSWLAFLGGDDNGKVLMAKEVAKVVFGSEHDFVTIGLSRWRDNSAEEVASGRKRARNEHGGEIYDRFAEAVRDNPRRLFYVEDVDQMDYGGVKRFERAMRNGGVSIGDECLPLKDVIVVFSCSAVDNGEREEEEHCVSLDLNVATEEGSGIRIMDSVDMKVIFGIQVL